MKIRPFAPLIALLALVHPAAAQLTISEVVAIAVADDKGNEPELFQDEDGDLSDIVEIHNAGPEQVSLAGYSLTDDEDDLRKWKFSSNQRIAAGQYLVVFASGKNKTGLFASIPHTNFTLNRSGEYLALVHPDGTVLDSFDPLPKMYDRVSYGHEGYMKRATPGEANSSALDVPSTGVKFSIKSRTFTEPFTVEITANNLPEGARIGYTLNRKVPEESLFAPPTWYSGPITIDSSTQIRARVFEDGKLPSEVETETYVKVSEELKDWSSNLPLIVLDNNDSGLPTKTRFIPTSWMILEPQATGNGDEKRTSIAQEAAVHTRAGMRSRGSSTSGNAKRSLALEAWYDDADWADKDIQPLGLPADSDWVLSGRMQFDRALIRNPFMYEMGRQMDHWAPRTRFVEVFMNLDGGDIDENDYFGVYTLIEKIKIAPDRVQIEEANGSTKGGFIFKVDRVTEAGGDIRISAGGESEGVWVEPQGPAVTSQQRTALPKFINDAVAAMKSDDPENPVTGYRSYIDTRSWIDEYLCRTLTRDPDGLRLSTYLYQPLNGKIFYGPLWDFDRTMGNDSDSRSKAVNQWVDYFPTRGWWTNLLGSGVNRKGGTAAMPEFWQEWIDRFHELRRTSWTDENMASIIDSMAAEIREAQERNFVRWPGTRPDSGDVKDYNNGVTGWEGEIVHLKGWLSAHAEWMEDQFVNKPSLENPGTITAGEAVKVNSGGSLFSPQEAWYTTNGTDPRLPGGEVNPDAILAGKTIQPSESMEIILRAKRGEEWSGPIKSAIVVNGVPASADNLLVTEIMYHPRAGQLSEQAVGWFHEDAFEFIELANVGDQEVSLVDVEFTNGIRFIFNEADIQMLAPGQRLVVVSNKDAFIARYGADVPIAGDYIGQLSNSGETLTLQHRESIIHEFDYNDRAPWPETPDEFGFSLALRSVKTGTDLSDASQWTVDSSAQGGSPGSAGETPPTVVVNEVLANSGVAASDAIELYNASDSEVDLSGWWLSDDPRTPKKFAIPAGTILNAGDYLVFRQDSDSDPNNNTTLAPEYFGNAFGLGSTGDSAWLFSATPDGTLTGYQDGFSFGDTLEGATVGRYATADAAVHHVIQSAPSLGAANAGPAVGPVVITEIMYAPADGMSEYVELQNVSETEVELFDAFSTWRLSGIDYAFPQNVILAANETILVVEGDPITFRAAYAVPEAVRIFGPYTGKLDNNGETLRLQRSYSRFDENGNPEGRLYTLEEVDYADQSPWPVEATLGGTSLERVELSVYGDQSSNWQPVSGGTPGVYAAPEPGADLVAWLEGAFNESERGDASISGLTADPDSDGLSNLAEYVFGTAPKAADSAVLTVDREGSVATLAYRRRPNADATVTLEASSDLKTWTTVAGHETSSTLGNMLENVTIRDSVAIGEGSRYLRLRVTAK